MYINEIILFIFAGDKLTTLIKIYSMKIAIPTRDKKVDDHFGHCEYYTVLTISDNKKIEESNDLIAPQACGCKSNIAETLKQMNVDTMLAGNMGMGALNKIQAAGIKVYRGCSGDIEAVVNKFLKGEINDSGLICDHHTGQEGNHQHQCNH
jgi:predicted Fe-Mo cluster-binding NifX family protein